MALLALILVPTVLRAWKAPSQGLGSRLMLALIALAGLAFTAFLGA